MKPFDPNDETRMSRRKLPHWEQDGCTYFVTFRMVDSLAQSQLQEWEEDLRIWKDFHPPPWDAITQADYSRRFTARIHGWLDAGAGSCMLARPDVREVVVGAIRHFEGTRYNLDAFVVMPNHVHVLVTPWEPWGLGQIQHSWKSYTAHEINRLLGRTGAFWHEEGFDHIVRDAAHLERFQRYIAENPAKAKLRDDEYFLHVRPYVPPV